MANYGGGATVRARACVRAAYHYRPLSRRRRALLGLSRLTADRRDRIDRRSVAVGAGVRQSDCVC